LQWNISGKCFFDLCIKFEELYNDSQLKIDMIAERVLTLGGTPVHTFVDYMTYNTLIIANNIHNDEEAISLIMSSPTRLLQIERVILTQ
jgi:starvation-inducible DNA-binding protein